MESVHIFFPKGRPISSENKGFNLNSHLKFTFCIQKLKKHLYFIYSSLPQISHVLVPSVEWVPDGHAWCISDGSSEKQN